MFKVKVHGIKEVITYLEGLSNFRSKQFLNEAMAYLSAQIKLRTARGVDYTGKSFPPYSLMHEGAREAKGLQTARVDLFFTGSMFSSMRWK